MIPVLRIARMVVGALLVWQLVKLLYWSVLLLNATQSNVPVAYPIGTYFGALLVAIFWVIHFVVIFEVLRYAINRLHRHMAKTEAKLLPSITAM